MLDVAQISDMCKSTKKVFDFCSSCYLSEDQHWEGFEDIICKVVSKIGNSSILDAGCDYPLFFVPIMMRG